jgi:pilus assembly protein Flp/PilA
MHPPAVVVLKLSLKAVSRCADATHVTRLLPAQRLATDVHIGLIEFIQFLQLRVEQANNDRGTSLVEYALLLAFIAAICIGALTFLGGELPVKLSSVGESLKK